jgi:hypothetical protein
LFSAFPVEVYPQLSRVNVLAHPNYWVTDFKVIDSLRTLIGVRTAQGNSGNDVAPSDHEEDDDEIPAGTPL